MSWLFVPSLRRFVSLAAGASLLLNLAMLMPSLFTLQVFDRVFASRSVETLLMLSALTLLTIAFAYSMDVARSRALASAGRTLHRLLSPATLKHAMHHAAAAGGRADADRLRDVALLRSFLDGGGIRALFDAPWLPIYLAVISLMHPLLGVTAAIGAGMLAMLAVVTERVTRDVADGMLRRSRSVGRHAESLIRHAEVIVGMGMSANAIDAWRGEHEQLQEDQRRLGAVSSRLSALARMARQGVQMAVLAIGAWLVVGADASPGIMVAATILLGRALQPVEHLITGWKQQIDARGAWQRLSQRDAPRSDAQRLRLPPPAGRIVLERVVFAHDATRPPLIKGVSLAIDAGESIGIIGASGAGKTTLVRLLLGLWHPQNGTVRLDEANIAHWDRDELGAHLGYLPQDVSLFAGTIAQNIARLGTVDSGEVIKAAQFAQAHDMILRLPDGYETVVGEAGTLLSGGQRQRIALARALYGLPKIVVLDEPDAHLDADGQDALKAALIALKTAGSTVIVVGHRGSLMSQLDKIAVLKDGALQAVGAAAAMFTKAPSPNVRPHPVLGSKEAA